MNKIFSTAKVSNYTDSSHTLRQPEVEAVFAKSRDSKELAYYWQAWRDASGKKMREQFIEVIKLTNEAAR
jgi:hypothetical protein